VDLETAIREAVTARIAAVPSAPAPLRALRLGVERRRRHGRALMATAVLAVLPAVAVTYGFATAAADTRVKHAQAQATAGGTSPGTAPAPSCTPDDLTNVHATWAPVSDLVLSGTLEVTSAAPSPCAMGTPRFTLVNDGGSPIDPNLSPADVLDAAAQTVIAPSQTAAAVIRWGGSYCGAHGPVALKWTLPSGLSITVALSTATTLQCVSSPYYEKGQSTTAASQFVVVP